jgi:iron-sulfur cluster assembly accessory protein
MKFLACLVFMVLSKLSTAFRPLTLHRQLSIHSLSTTSNIPQNHPLYSTVTDMPTTAEVDEKVILITSKAMSHIRDLKGKMENGKTCLRMGVKSGGCSGMSYVMDFIAEDGINDDDHIEMNGDIKCAVDPKSLLYLYGLQLDYSDELIGGGFKFSNPNAETSCGCGKSFGV